MQKYAIIEQFCDELLYHPGVHSQQLLDNLVFSAELIRFDQSNMTCGDNLDWKLVEAATFIKRQIPFCRTPTQEMIYDLLLEQGSTVH